MERDAFLARIASRLGREVGAAPTGRPSAAVPADYAARPLGDDTPRGDWPARFAAEVEALGGAAHIAETARDVSAILRGAIAAGRGEGAICTWARGEFAGWGVDWLWDEAGAAEFAAAADAGAPDIARLRELMRTADIGITTAQAAIVNTGTVVLLTGPHRNRSVSLLPRHHIALVREDQLTARMGGVLATFGGAPGETPPSSVHFITGPSRSADIENDLTIGVHGPAALTVIVLR